MRLSIVHLILITSCFILLSVVNSTVMGQVSRQTTRNQTSQNSQALSEIEEMRKMLRDRKAHQEEQRRLLQELQKAVSGTDEPANSPSAGSIPTAGTGNAHNTQYVTSESTLSKLEAIELLNKERVQHDADMKSARKEIDLLKRQLEIANKQMDSYQRPASSSQAAASRRTAPLGNKQTQGRTNARQAAQQQQQFNNTFGNYEPEPQRSEKDRKASDEIDVLRKMLREKQEFQDQQRKLIQELQQAVGGQ